MTPEQITLAPRRPSALAHSCRPRRPGSGRSRSCETRCPPPALPAWPGMRSNSATNSPSRACRTATIGTAIRNSAARAPLPPEPSRPPVLAAIKDEHGLLLSRSHGHTAPVVHGLQVLAFTAPGATLFPQYIGDVFIAFTGVSRKSLAEVHAGDTLIYARLQADARAAAQTPATGPGGQPGNDSDSSAAGSHPERQLFGQATPEPSPTLRPATPARAGHATPTRIKENPPRSLTPAAKRTRSAR